MGGFGSGKQFGQRCADDMHALDVRKINRAGLLRPGNSFGWQWTRNGEEVAAINIRMDGQHVWLNYRNRSANANGGEWEAMTYRVGLDWTACTYGGERVWWRCPGDGCGRRVAVLYGGRVFACRQCHRLAYRSQREDAGDRAMRRANTGRRKLGWPAGIAFGPGPKPIGMHWRTFNRLLQEQATDTGMVLARTNEWLARVQNRLVGLRKG